MSTSIIVALMALLPLWHILLATIVFKVFPDLLGKVLLKGVEYASEKQLARLKDTLARETAVQVESLKAELARDVATQIERIKADLAASYATLQTSVNLISAGQSGMREHILSATQTLWATILKLRADFGGLVTLTVMYSPKEIAQMVESNAWGKTEGFVQLYRDEKMLHALTGAFFSEAIDQTQLFCGDRLWLLFYVLRAAYIRHAWLMTVSLKQLGYQDWRSDSFYVSLLQRVIPKTVVQEASSRQELGLQSLLHWLEAEFLHEAHRLMSGSKALADALGDTQSVLLLEQQKIADQKSGQPALERG